MDPAGDVAIASRAHATQSANRRLAGEAVTLAVGKVVATGSTLLLFVLLSHALSPAEYGTFRQVWMITKGVPEIFALGLPISILYFTARLPDRMKRALVVQSVILLSAAALVVSGLIFGFADQIADRFSNPALADLLRLFSFYPLLGAPTLAVESVLIASGRAAQFAIFTIVTRTSVLVVAAATVLLGGSLGQVFAFLLLAGVLELSRAAYLLGTVTRFWQTQSGPGDLARQPGIREQVALGLPTGLSNMVGILNQELDKLVIAASFTVSQFALFVNGAFEIPILGTAVGSVSSVLMPELTRRFNAGEKESLLALWHEAVAKIGLLLFPLVVFLAVVAEDLLGLLFSDVYRNSAVIFQIYLVAALPKLTWYGMALVAMGQRRAPLHGSLVALTTNLILNFVLIRWLGFTGPAIATVLATYALVWFYLWRIRSTLQVSWAAVFPWLRLGRMLVAAIIAGGALLPVTWLRNLPPVAYLGLALGVYSIAVVLVYRVGRVLTADELAGVRSAFQRFRLGIGRGGGGTA